MKTLTKSFKEIINSVDVGSKYLNADNELQEDILVADLIKAVSEYNTKVVGEDDEQVLVIQCNQCGGESNLLQ